MPDPEKDLDVTAELPTSDESSVREAANDATEPDTAHGRDTSVAPPGPSLTGEFVPTPDTGLTGAYVPGSQQNGDFSDARHVPRIPGYQIVGELGRGGMGVVYNAIQIGLARQVALKMILSGTHASSHMIARFVAEAQAVGRFQHPNIVQVFEVGEHEGLPYFSLEFVDGGTLQQKVSREPQPPRYAAAVVEQLARAMQYAHDRGIIHRDLKPANILLATDGTPKITDFGLAKVLEADSENTQSGQVLGTPSYMSPEQARGDTSTIDTPADGYALGAILYDLLTGRPPFAGSSILDTLEMVRTREPLPPSELTGKLPRDIETICLKCLQKEPSKRYGSAAELADDLRRFLDGRPIVARPISRAERAWRWARRNPVGAVAVLLAIALLVVPSILSGMLYVAEGRATQHAEQAEREKEIAQRERDDKEQARASEEIAKLKAVDEEKKATAARDLARQRLGVALDIARGSLLKVDELMRNKHSLAPLRLAIIQAILKDLDKIRTTADKDPLIDRNEAIAYSRIADIFSHGNQVQDAAIWLRKAYGVTEALAVANPTDHISVRNLAAIGNQLADVEWRLGNGTKARSLYADGLKLRHERRRLVEPFNNPDALLAAQADIAASLSYVAFADLRLGNIDSAVEHYQASDRAFAELRTKGTLAVRRARAEIQIHLGDARMRQKLFHDAEKHYRAALDERETLLKLTPKPPHIVAILRSDIANSRLYLGDYFLVTHEPARAAAEYTLALKAFRELIDDDRENLEFERRVAATDYRMGVVNEKQVAIAAVAGWPTQIGTADAHFLAALAIRERLARIDSSDTQGKLEVMLVLGRLGRTDAAEKIAIGLLAVREPDPALLFQTACGFAVASAGANNSKNASRCRDRAFQVLEDLITRGWRVPGLLETEPDLESLRGDPRFNQLVKSSTRK